MMSELSYGPRAVEGLWAASGASASTQVGQASLSAFTTRARWGAWGGGPHRTLLDEQPALRFKAARSDSM